MDKEELLLIQVCRSYLNGDVLVPEEATDWKRYFKIAKLHNLTAISHCVFQNSKIQLPADVAEGFMNSFLDVVFISEMQSQALVELQEAAKGCECPYILFKGALLKDLYPVPESRSMGDIDLLIKSKDKQKLGKALSDIGFSLSGTNGAVDSYNRGNVVFEVHTKLSGNADNDAFNDAFENAHFDGVRGELSNEYHLAYMIYHTANHLRYTGAGIRLVLDIAVFLKEKSVDMDKVFSILEEYSLTQFARVLLSISKQWFGYGELYTGNTQKAQQYLVEDGIFGTMKDSVKATVSRLRQCGAFDDNTADTSPVKLKLRLAFPSYSTLRRADYIKFLDGRPYLLPYAWCYRLAYNLKHRPDRLAEKLKNIDDEKLMALAEEELAFFEEIGLE